MTRGRGSWSKDGARGAPAPLLPSQTAQRGACGAVATVTSEACREGVSPRALDNATSGYITSLPVTSRRSCCRTRRRATTDDRRGRYVQGKVNRSDSPSTTSSTPDNRRRHRPKNDSSTVTTPPEPPVFVVAAVVHKYTVSRKEVIVTPLSTMGYTSVASVFR